MGPGWDVSSLAGTPRIGRKIIREKEGSNRLGVGQLLETESQWASLQAEDIGQIERAKHPLTAAHHGPKSDVLHWIAIHSRVHLLR